jgi:hypothetical protein
MVNESTYPFPPLAGVQGVEKLLFTVGRLLLFLDTLVDPQVLTTLYSHFQLFSHFSI